MSSSLFANHRSLEFSSFAASYPSTRHSAHRSISQHTCRSDAVQWLLFRIEALRFSPFFCSSSLLFLSSSPSLCLPFCFSEHSYMRSLILSWCFLRISTEHDQISPQLSYVSVFMSLHSLSLSGDKKRNSNAATICLPTTSVPLEV